MDLYIIEFLSYHDPVLVGTNYEIDCRFAYMVSNLKWDTFFVQHGNYAGYFVNEEYRAKNISSNVTDMFIFNNGVSSHLVNTYNYNGNFHIVGSITANQLLDMNLKSNPTGKYLYFISEWESRDHLDFIQNQQLIIKFAAKYCIDNGFILKILLRNNENQSDYIREVEFYKDITGNNCEFANKFFDVQNYSNIVDSYGILFLSSTLGYEFMLNQNLSVACVTYRGLKPGFTSEQFGWPLQDQQYDLGLTNIITYDEVKRVLDDLKFGGISSNIRSKLLAYDPGNTVLINFLDQKLVI